MDKDLRAAEHSEDPLRHAIHLRRLGRLEECADTLETAWLNGDSSCGDALFGFLNEWREQRPVAVASRLDRLACAGNDRARAAWEKWFPELGAIVGVSENMRGLRRTILEHTMRSPDQVLILKGADGVGKRTAARAFHQLVRGSEFRECQDFDLPLLPPEGGTFHVTASKPGVWEGGCVTACRTRRARLVIAYYSVDDPPSPTLDAIEHVDYVITPLDVRREDIRSLVVERFPEWFRINRAPRFERVKTIEVQPEAIAELSRRPWHGLNARGVFLALDQAASAALQSSDDPETLSIGVQHLPRLNA